MTQTFRPENAIPFPVERAVPGPRELAVQWQKNNLEEIQKIAPGVKPAPFSGECLLAPCPGGGRFAEPGAWIVAIPWEPGRPVVLVYEDEQKFTAAYGECTR